jgi:hypothetical protein
MNEPINNPIVTTGHSTPDDKTLAKLQDLFRAGDAPFAALREDGTEIVAREGDELYDADTRFDWQGSKLRRLLSRNDAHLAGRVEKLGLAVVITDPIANPWIAEAEAAGVRWADVPRLDTDPRPLHQAIFTRLQVESQSWGNGVQSVPLYRPWPAFQHLYLFRRPDPVPVGGDLLLAAGVRLRTSGFVPFPSRGRFEDCLVQWGSGPRPWDPVVVERTGGYNPLTRQVTPPETRPALVALPDFIAVAARVARKAAEPEPAKRRLLS